MSQPYVPFNERVMHFWYSAKMEEVLREEANREGKRMLQNYCVIDGVEHRYNECGEKNKPFNCYDDNVYIGRGTYSRSVRQ